jgi:hypothetical protein
MIWSVRSYFDRLSTNGDRRCQRRRIEKLYLEKESGLEWAFMIWSVRSYFDKLSTNGDRRCQRVRIEKPFGEKIRVGMDIHDLERPFILQQAQHERR